jgi:alkylated DNA repair dioxygenase AlkB
MASDEPGLFGHLKRPEAVEHPAAARKLPEGFKYQPDVITRDEERDLIGHIETLPFREFEFHGFTGKRRVVSFGWRYDFSERQLQRAVDIPPFLLPSRDRAAQFAGLGPNDLQHVLVTEYAPGAAIGWHRDKAVFAEVVGISLLSPASFRLRRQIGAKYERITINAEPRSAYLLSGLSRTQWEHSIPAVQALRYSVTFRNFKGDR